MTMVKSIIKVPWAPPLFDEADKQAAVQVIQSGWMTHGKVSAAFEADIGHVCQSKYAVVVNNGTSALIVALLAHGIGPGDEVLVPTMTFIATVNAVIAVGARPVLVDCDPATVNVTAELLKRRLTDKTKAIIFVDVYGMPCDILAMREFAKIHRLILIEDAAEAIGAQYREKPIGSFDHTAIFSFHMAKLTPTVEGGCVVTQDKDLDDKMRQIRNQGMAGQYHYVCFGLNFRSTDIQSALGRNQLAKLSSTLRNRNELAKQYRDGLAGLVDFQEVPSYVTTHPYMIFSVFFKNSKIRNQVNQYLHQNGVDTRICWVPTHLQPYHNKLFLGRGGFPNSEKIAERNLSLPMGNALSPAEVSYVIEQVKSGFEKFGDAS